MIDRTTFDLRLAEHAAMATRANRRGGMEGTGAARRATRVTRKALAAALVALARRLDPAAMRGGASGQGAAA